MVLALTPGSALVFEPLPASPPPPLSLAPQPATAITKPAVIHLVVPRLRTCASFSGISGRGPPAALSAVATLVANEAEADRTFVNRDEPWDG
jgi:hypothetical protein